MVLVTTAGLMLGSPAHASSSPAQYQFSSTTEAPDAGDAPDAPGVSCPQVVDLRDGEDDGQRTGCKCKVGKLAHASTEPPPDIPDALPRSSPLRPERGPPSAPLYLLTARLRL